jgi:endonuclease/exonuclease/phosphatase family metal-dependent hydrolase
MDREMSVLIALGMAVFLGGDPRLRAEPGAREVRVMSFNIRYGTAQDGANHWDRRREFLVETIRAFDPDLLGTQETLGFQRDYLAQQLPDHVALGVGREDGREAGEMAALYYRKERFTPVRSGHFWLSETPEVPGSKSWDSSLPRMATWVELRDRRTPDARPIWFLNTHFDHRGDRARLESARMIRQRAQQAAAECSLVVTGDFNAGEGSAPYRALFGESEGPGGLLLDTFRKVHPEKLSDEGTFSGFSASATGGARIDWIAVSPDFQVQKAGIDRTAREEHTPSDHFPVTATLVR